MGVSRLRSNWPSDLPNTYAPLTHTARIVGFRITTLGLSPGAYAYVTMAAGNDNITSGGYSNYFGQSFATFTLLGTPGKIARYQNNAPLANPTLKGILTLEAGQDNPTTMVVNNGTGFGMTAPVASPTGLAVKVWMNPPPTAAPTNTPTTVRGDKELSCTQLDAC